MLNLYGPDGEIQFDKDRRRRAYFLQHVNQNTVFFHDLNGEAQLPRREQVLRPGGPRQSTTAFIKTLFDAYSKKFRFQTFLGAFKYYTSYTLKTSTESGTWSASRTASAWSPSRSREGN